MGDSNTKEFKFGVGKGTFGESYPGMRVKAARIRNIEPAACIGYSNIAICCGTNDLRDDNCRSEKSVHNLYSVLVGKIQQIRTLCPGAKLFILPVLPTKFASMNRRIMHFNRLIFHGELLRPGIDAWMPPVTVFLDKDEMLSSKYA